MGTRIHPCPGAASLLSSPPSRPCVPSPWGLPPILYSLSIHAQHHAQRGVATSSEVVPVAAHSDGVQPVPHGEAPTAPTAPTEVKAALGKGRGRAPEAQGSLVSGLPGPLSPWWALALAILTLHPGSVVCKGSEELDPRP